ncbi:MAG: hypothetical protein EBR23_07935 [Planctomycetia bacterium]|nr:hypothetical protein [Planctomycetia bacterium]
MDQDTRQGRLEAAHIWADLVSKVLGGVAILVAAWWTYTNFTVERTHDPTMLVTVTPTAHPLRDGHVLLNVDIFLQNIGRVAIKPRFPSPEEPEDAGLEISIVEIEPLQHGTSAGTARTSAGDDVRWFDWTAGAGDPRSLVYKRNLLATNDDFRNGRYQLNPGVRYREPFACIVERDRLYAIRARFWTDEGAIADLVYVDTFSVGEAPAADAGRDPAAVGRDAAGTARTGS